MDPFTFSLENTIDINTEKSYGDKSSSRRPDSHRYFDNPAFERDIESCKNVSVAKQDGFDLKARINQHNHEKDVMIIDAVFFILDYLQIFALIQSLSSRWPWPLPWTQSMSFLFIFNLDSWELSKRASGAYIAARDYFVPSEDVPMSFIAMVLCWIFAILGLIAGFLYVRRIFKSDLTRERYNILIQASIISSQVLALPIGAQVGKLFWCREMETSVLDSDNYVDCWTGAHGFYIFLAIIIALLAYAAFPFLLYRMIKKQVVSVDERKHEIYLRVKHTEQVFNLNSSWDEYLFINFASFKRQAVYTRPINHVIKFFLLLFYASMFNQRLAQISVIFAILFVHLIYCCVVRPYRVTSFNFPCIWNLVCLNSCVVIGLFQNIPDIQSVFLNPRYIEGELILINVCWVIGTILWIFYVVLRWKKLLLPSSKLWPTLYDRKSHYAEKTTKRILQLTLNGKDVLTKASNTPKLLVPVHELVQQITLINSQADLAEKLGCPMTSTMREVADELAEAYNRYAPDSIFTRSRKSKVHTTADALMSVLPAFSSRLQQRNFDFILVSPLKRRIILKMFAVACFRRTSTRVNLQAHTRAVNKVWSGVGSDEGFYEEESIIQLEKIRVKGLKKKPAQPFVKNYGSTSC